MVIDVRSPAEFALDHIPGAMNCPVLSDSERATVGTIYKQHSPFEARKLGAAIVARKLLPSTPSAKAPHGETRPPGSIVIRGSEGMAVQFAQCCHPIPGDPIIGLLNKGQGMLIHTHDCPAIAKTRSDPDKVFDVEWAPETKKLFNVNIRIVVKNERGVLAKVAASIADEESNIQNVTVDPQDGGRYATMNFTLQVADRNHLARIMIELRRIPEVARITRLRA